MVVEWAKLEANRAREIHMVDVRELNLKKNEKGEIIEELPAMDLTNEEFMRHQRDPLVLQAVGSMTDFMSLKSQTFTLVITVARLIKGDPGLKLTAAYIREKWTTSRTLKLVALVSKEFGETEKNLLDSPSPMQDNSS